MKPSLLQGYFQTNHPEKKDCNSNYFKRLGESAINQRLDSAEKQYQQSVGMIAASYEIAIIVANV